METEVRLSDDARYIVVVQSGTLTVEEIKRARAMSLPLYAHTDRVLVDYRSSDLSEINMFELDTLSIELKGDVPDIKRMAVVQPPDGGCKFTYLMNICCIEGVPTCVFDTIEAARSWLMKP